MMPKLLGGLCMIAGLASAGLAFAQEIPPAPRTAAAADAETLTLDELGSLYGGTGIQAVITDQDLVAINQGNSVSGDVVGSGDIVLANGALASFDGVGNFVMNTGHNNNLQSSMSVSVVVGGGGS
jgi:hypothetical protein